MRREPASRSVNGTCSSIDEHGFRSGKPPRRAIDVGGVGFEMIAQLGFPLCGEREAAAFLHARAASSLALLP